MNSQHTLEFWRRFGYVSAPEREPKMPVVKIDAKDVN